MTDVVLNRSRVARIASALCTLSLVAACSNTGNQNLTSPSLDSTAAKPPSVQSVDSTSVTFANFNPTTLSLTIGSLTTSTLGQAIIGQGKIHLKILVDSVTHNPVPCGTPNSTYVRFDGAGGGIELLGQVAAAVTVDLDDLETLTDGAVHNVHCGDSICIQAQYIPGGGQTHVSSHTSADTPYQVVCTTTCGTLSLGYWKNHFSAGWPASVVAGGLTIGTVHYTAAELHSILWAPSAGNGVIILAHQLITAKLNVANGDNPGGAILAAIAAGDALIGGLVAPPVGSGWLHPSLTGALTTTLDTYNKRCEPAA
jgi:hypothetical protein